jgi:hypothetical protein
MSFLFYFEQVEVPKKETFMKKDFHKINIKTIKIHKVI